MEAKTIKISKENYVWLAQVAGELQKKQQRPVSFDEAINELKKKKTKQKSLKRFAGIWKISDTKAHELIEQIYKERKIISRRI